MAVVGIGATKGLLLLLEVQLSEAQRSSGCQSEVLVYSMVLLQWLSFTGLVGTSLKLLPAYEVQIASRSAHYPLHFTFHMLSCCFHGPAQWCIKLKMSTE